MFKMILTGGPFMIVLIMLALVVIYLSIKNIKKQFHTNIIVYCGIIAALVGIVATHVGLIGTIKAISSISDISPIILINGFKIALNTTYFGGIILFLSMILWCLFNMRHSQ